MKIKFPETIKDQSEKMDWIAENNDDILYAKKTEIKFVDISGGFDVAPLKIINVDKNSNGEIEKEVLEVKAVINTTNIMDSHDDVHIPGLWTKTLKENKRIKFVQEHQMRFDKIIADKDDLKAYVKTMAWKDLGYDVEGKTQALMFNANVRRRRNGFMYDQYKDGNVDNHSVSMIYVKIKTALNSDKPEHTNYKETYDEYISQVANKKEAEKQGYFWVVTEAKAREGSAVVDGSNFVTPTLSSRSKHLKDDQEEEAEKSLNPRNKKMLEALKKTFIN